MNVSMTTKALRVTRSGLTGLALVMASALAATAFAQPGPGGHGMGGPMMFGGPPEHAARMIDHMLDGLNASDAQRAQIKQIAQAAAADLKPQRDAARALQDRAMQVFTTPTVDANAAEQVRQQMLAQHDQLSRRSLAAMIEISRVLTPEQRAKIGERMKQRREAAREREQRMERGRPQQ